MSLLHRVLPLVFLLPAACYFDEPRLAENLAPQVNGFIVDGERQDRVSVREGEEITVTLVAWDPNGDPFGPELITWETTDGTVIGAGSSVRVAAPEGITWERPPQPVSFIVTVTVADGVNDPATGSLTVEVLPPCPPENQAPIVNSVTADPEGIALGERTTVRVDAEDPEGAELTYEWIPPFGSIEGSGPEVEWVTDEVCCTDWYDVEVVVSDGCKAKRSFVSVHVDV